MKIGIVAAMELEIEALKNMFFPFSVFNFLGKEFLVSEKNGNHFILLCSGQGKTNSAMYAQLLIEKFSPEIIINIGVCGGINPSCAVGDVYLGQKYCHYDIRKKQSLGKFPFRLFFEADKDLLEQFSSVDPNLRIGTFGTGEGFVSSDSQKKALIKEFNIDCVDMESATLAQCCYLNEIKFLSIRVVTDIADSNAKNTSEISQENNMMKIFELVSKIFL